MEPATIIDSRYRLERLLGTGGMAEVWLAEDRRLSRWVALKILRNEDPELASGLAREARLVARLQHPNIVAVHDAGEHEGLPYLVMEYVHGHSLRGLLEARGRLSEAEALRYGLQAAAALEYAHAAGVIHCDIKPENLMVDEQGTAKLTDFGVSLTVNRTMTPDQARDILGTLAYLAPEVIQGAPPDPRSDVYSLALTLYELVAGRVPFEGATPAAIAGQRLARPAPPLRTLAPDASPALESALARALSLNPDGRWPTVADFAAALRGSNQRTAPVAAIPPVGRPAPRPQPSRHSTARVQRQAAAVPPPPANTGGGSGAVTAAIFAGVILLAAGAGIAAALFLSHGDDNGGTPSPTPLPSLTAPASTPATTPTRGPGATNTPEPTQTATPSPSATPATTVTATPTRTPTQPAATPTRTNTPPASSPTAATATPGGGPQPTATPRP
ncbi:MAG: protein kinase [Dehalococcoidia bacterium]